MSEQQAEDAKIQQTEEAKLQAMAKQPHLANITSSLSRFGGTNPFGDPIVVVGMACRFPGGVVNPHGFWSKLVSQHDCVSSARFGFSGGFLENLSDFDCSFFNLSRPEGTCMDPQQRMLLEVAWEAMESAGDLPISDQSVGVFVGLSHLEYRDLSVKASVFNKDLIDARFAGANSLAMVAGRIAYHLNLHGPALCVDTACSSGLTALHLACQSLRLEECSSALVGACNHILSTEKTTSHQKAGMLSKSGRCKSFDQSADGYVRSEGCGMLVLKRLSSALRQRSRILGIIAGTGITHNGYVKQGIRAPNAEAQARCLQEALRVAKIPPAAVDYVEAHGTGTPVGDPIETAAIHKVFGQDTNRHHPLLVGAVKSNVGHMECASAMPSLMKVLLSFRFGLIPGNLHFGQATSEVATQLKSIPAQIVVHNRFWDEEQGQHVAVVCSNGFSGTNSHAVLFNYPEDEKTQPPPPPPTSVHVLPMSARSVEALQDTMLRFSDALKELEGLPPSEFVNFLYTATARRSHWNHRLAVTGSTLSDLQRAITTRTGSPLPSKSSEVPVVVFLFPGQGSQYPGMALDLYAEYPVFRQALDDCQVAFDNAKQSAPSDAHRFPPLLQLLKQASAEELQETCVSQPLIFSVEYAFAKLWQSFGVKPWAALGHSIGEVAAMCAVGVLDLPQAALLVYHRARLMASLPSGDGGMLVVVGANARKLSIEAIEVVLKTQESESKSPASVLSVAADNGPTCVTLSGDKASISQVNTVLGAYASEGIRTVTLNVSHAFHSAMMSPIHDAFFQELQKIPHSPPSADVKLFSTVHGRALGADEQMEPTKYWITHALNSVQFGPAIADLQQQLATYLQNNGGRKVVFLEVGPGKTLNAMGRKLVQLPGTETVWLTSIQDGGNAAHFKNTVASLYEAGFNPSWEQVLNTPSSAVVSPFCPTYAFQHVPLWMEGISALGEEPQVVSAGAPQLVSNANADVHVQDVSETKEKSSMPVVDRKLADSLKMTTGCLCTVLRTSPEALQATLQSPLSSVSFFDLGLDSPMFPELVSKLKRTFLVDDRLTTQCLHVYDTIALLSEYLHELVTNPLVKAFRKIDDVKDSEWRWNGLLRTPTTPVFIPSKAIFHSHIVFLTGATGYLGSRLLLSLVTSPSVSKVYCLVRAPTVVAVLRTLQTDLPQETVDKVQMVLGDVAKPFFGLPEEQYNGLTAAKINVFIHCAAAVNVMKSYQNLKEANVTGCHEVLRFVASARQLGQLIPIHHVSTAGVFYDFPAEQGVPSDVFPEESPISAGSYAEGYRSSKWVAEKTMRNARSHGFVVSIYRVGVLWGAVSDGICNRDAIATRLLRSVLSLGVAPVVESGFFDITPVDFCASAITRLALSCSMSPDATSNDYFVVNPTGIRLADIWMAARAAGFQIRDVSVYDFLSKLEKRIRAHQGDFMDVSVSESLRLGYLKPRPQFLADSLVADLATIHPSLQPCSTIPPLNQLMQSYLDWGRASGFFAAKAPRRHTAQVSVDFDAMGVMPLIRRRVSDPSSQN